MIRTVDMYAEEILKKYEEKAKLISPTRTDIKDACMARFSENTTIIDKEILRKFFRASHEDDLFKTIEKCNPEKFRTIQNFLSKKTSNTSKKNLDLIAWLIDFNPRPYSLYRKPKVGGDSGIDLGIDTTPKREENINDVTTGIAISNQLEIIPEKEKNVEDESEVENESETGSKYEPKTEVKNNSNSKKWIWATLSTIVISVLFFYNLNHFLNTTKTNDTKTPLEENLINPEQKCMVWADTEFILADCADSILPKFETKMIPYDTNLYENMKRVEVSRETKFFEPNNVTPRIWYVKISPGKYEYFTAAGIHPVSGKPLNHITGNHIEKYIPKKRENDEKSYVEEK